jgi:hypothetical protein
MSAISKLNGRGRLSKVFDTFRHQHNFTRLEAHRNHIEPFVQSLDRKFGQNDKLEVGLLSQDVRGGQGTSSYNLCLSYLWATKFHIKLRLSEQEDGGISANIAIRPTTTGDVSYISRRNRDIWNENLKNAGLENYSEDTDGLKDGAITFANLRFSKKLRNLFPEKPEDISEFEKELEGFAKLFYGIHKIPGRIPSAFSSLEKYR